MKTLLIVLLIIQGACAFENELIDEESPYLLQHAHNPVNWIAYSDEAFTRAKKEHKAIFLSIGYSTCHWCHVMASESFENETIATILNENFISIKVDREEMPHIDTYYQQMHLHVKKRSAGWPMNVVLDENAKAFFIATYIPPTDKYGILGLEKRLTKISAEYKNHPQKIARKVEAFIKMNSEKLQLSQKNRDKEKLFTELLEQYDDIYYGFRTAPKFPEVSKVKLLFILDSLHVKGAEKMALDMLDAMALKGLYDHIEGGFFRYSTDAAYEIPHFEKMLYNQGELIPLYVEAYKRTSKKLYKEVVNESIAMLEQRFEKESLFYTASDADTHHHEGAYFVFSKEEIMRALKNSLYKIEIEEALLLEDGENFEERFHLNFYTDSRPKGFNAFQKELQKLRNTREYPFVDTKILTSYNAMVIKALFKASYINPSYTKKAKKSLDALVDAVRKKEVLYHQTFIGKNPHKVALLEDYSFLISAYITGYDTTMDTKMLYHAKELLDEAIRTFYINKIWYLNSKGLRVEADLRDKYYSSALGVMLQNLFRLAALVEKSEYQAIASETLTTLEKNVNTPATNIAELMHQYGVIVVKNSMARLKEYRKEIEKINYPFLHVKAEKSKQFLACEVGACFAYSKDFLLLKQKIEARSRE